MRKSVFALIVCLSVCLVLVPRANASPSCTFSSNLFLGARGAAVVCLQNFLIERGYRIPAGATGYFGYQTKRAVAAWQGDNGVAPTFGYFGPISRKAYVAAHAAPSPFQKTTSVSAPLSSGASPVILPAGGSPTPSVPVTGLTSALATTPSYAPPVVLPAERVVPSASGGLQGTVIAPPIPARSTGEVRWACDFEGEYCGFYEQSKVGPTERRSSLVSTARSGSSAVRLLTLPGDTGVHSSGEWERNDLSLAASPSYCNAGQEEWWAFSVFFPSEYVVPEGGSAVMDFHHNASGGQANFHITSGPRGLEVRGFYGDVKNPSEYRTVLGVVERNVWYDFVLYVKWSPNNDGFMTVWMNGKRMLSHEGPTLYPGLSCYLKLANYHHAFGGPQVLIFDRVMRGTGADAVALTPLE